MTAAILARAYGQFKVTRYLMRVTGDSRYGDAMETILCNTILGARPISPDGVSFYYADYNNHDAKKVDYEQKWPCCSGTFPQLTADYGISSYLRSAHGINVNLYVPSRITWQQGSARASLTHSGPHFLIRPGKARTWASWSTADQPRAPPGRRTQIAEPHSVEIRHGEFIAGTEQASVGAPCAASVGEGDASTLLDIEHSANEGDRRSGEGCRDTP